MLKRVMRKGLLRAIVFAILITLTSSINLIGQAIVYLNASKNLNKFYPHIYNEIAISDGQILTARIDSNDFKMIIYTNRRIAIRLNNKNINQLTILYEIRNKIYSRQIIVQQGTIKYPFPFVEICSHLSIEGAACDLEELDRMIRAIPTVSPFNNASIFNYVIESFELQLKRNIDVIKKVSYSKMNNPYFDVRSELTPLIKNKDTIVFKKIMIKDAFNHSYFLDNVQFCYNNGIIFSIHSEKVIQKRMRQTR